MLSTSCSLLHVPLDVRAETSIAPQLRGRLAFARQKVDEVVALGRALSEGRAAAGLASAGQPAAPVNARVRARLDALGAGTRRRAYAERRAAQAGSLPVLPTTTIGSFPQTEAIRKARAATQAGRIEDSAYEAAMRAEINRVIALQEDIGLTCWSTASPSATTWCSTSPSARRVRGHQPRLGPVLRHPLRPAADPARRRGPARADDRRLGVLRPVPHQQTGQGHAHGPVTMLAWSFVRDDQPLADTARQVALAIRDEIARPGSRRDPDHPGRRACTQGTSAAAAGRPRGLPGLGGRRVPPGYVGGR